MESSARLIESHYENNYGAALNRLNAISEEIERFDFDTASDQSLVRLKRDETAALNSTLLHELYFASLGGDGRVPAGHPSRARSRRTSVRSTAGVGSLSGSRMDWPAVGLGASYYVPRDGRLINQIASEHDQCIAGGVPILASICTSTRITWNSARTPMPTLPPSCANIDWSAVKLRYERCNQGRLHPVLSNNHKFAGTPSISVEEVREMLKSGTPVQIIDTRPKHYTTKAQDIMDGSRLARSGTPG